MHYPLIGCRYQAIIVVNVNVALFFKRTFSYKSQNIGTLDQLRINESMYINVVYHNISTVIRSNFDP